MERDRTLRRAILGGAAAGFAAALAAVFLLGRDPAPAGEWPIPGDAPGRPVEIEVLNATDIDGLARAVTRRLRRAGFDVVYFGTAAEPRDSTVLLVRRGDTTAAADVRAVLGMGRVARDPDDRLLLDVSVVLGRDAAALVRDP